MHVLPHLPHYITAPQNKSSFNLILTVLLNQIYSQPNKTDYETSKLKDHH